MPTLVKVELVRADVPTGNHRVYPKAVPARVVEKNHPTIMPVSDKEGQVSLGDMFGVVQRLEMEGDRVILRAGIEGAFVTRRSTLGSRHAKDHFQ